MEENQDQITRPELVIRTNSLESQPSLEINRQSSALQLAFKDSLELPSTSKPISTDSLYRMITSDYFNIHLTVEYLDRHEEAGVIDQLINSMYDKFVDNSLFYVPQLVSLICTKADYFMIEQYILDNCVNKIKFCLLVNWRVNSLMEDIEQGVHMSDEIESKLGRLSQHIEMTLVNYRRATQNKTLMKVKYDTKNLEDEIIRKAIDKEKRLCYYEFCIDFYKDLKNMCEGLRAIPRESTMTYKKDRRNYMIDFIKALNDKLQKQRQEETTVQSMVIQSFYKGVILPLDDGETIDDLQNHIVFS